MIRGLAVLLLASLVCSPALAGHRCNVAVQNFALQSGLVVTPFAVPVAQAVAVAQVNPYLYGFASGGTQAQGYSAAAVKASGMALDEATLDRLAAKVAALLKGGPTAQAIPEKPSLVQANCAACHGPTKQAGGFRVDTVLSPEAKLKAIGRLLADDATKRMPKGKNLDPQTLGLILQELATPPAGVPGPPASDPPAPLPEPAKP